MPHQVTAPPHTPMHIKHKCVFVCKCLAHLQSAYNANAKRGVAIAEMQKCKSRLTPCSFAFADLFTRVCTIVAVVAVATAADN